MQLVLMDASGRPVDGSMEWSPREAAEFLGTSENQLHKWRSAGGGPRARKASDGWSVTYTVADIVLWLNTRKPWTRPGGQKKAA